MYPAFEVLPGESNLSHELAAQRLELLVDLDKGSKGNADEASAAAPQFIVAPIQALMQPSPTRSLLGDLVTDAMRWGTGTDVAVLNAGTLRLDDVIRPGPLSNYQLESIFLFPDETRVLTVPLTGARLRDILEHGVADGSLGKGGFLQVSGVSYTYDPAAPSGRRIRGDIRRADGGIIAAGDHVRVAIPVYPACEGGDGYDVPEAATACASRAGTPRAADLLMKYTADSLKGEVTPPKSGRIVRAGNTNPG